MQQCGQNSFEYFFKPWAFTKNLNLLFIADVENSKELGYFEVISAQNRKAIAYFG
ncbi:hypothetical protein ADICYQ_1166 [Cyclobacterium qasimii M12-11B]|uniref:Uncharacterized protein n=1 Tax=Cyclobacterium qasimii M12-11B TaxID=641524 RepID=S7VK49_9BACT|nr:hypothetical protein ADICYQ_1166 [Cyclobacterium qasimii M12-11B]